MTIILDYEEWINRERRIRSTLLMGSAEIKNSGVCRVCGDCGEICLCHETNCPNCGGGMIADQLLKDLEKEVLGGGRIRCLYRFKNICNTVEQQSQEH